MEKERAIEIIKTKILEIEAKITVEDYNAWKEVTALTIQKILPSDINFHQKFE